MIPTKNFTSDPEIPDRIINAFKTGYPRATAIIDNFYKKVRPPHRKQPLMQYLRRRIHFEGYKKLAKLITIYLYSAPVDKVADAFDTASCIKKMSEFIRRFFPQSYCPRMETIIKVIRRRVIYDELEVSLEDLNELLQASKRARKD